MILLVAGYLGNASDAPVGQGILQPSGHSLLLGL